MSAVLIAPDPGPMARLREVVASADTMSVIVQRITDAERPETLKEIARAWRVPAGRLALWISEDRERSEQYANALRIAAEHAALETVRIADGEARQAVDPQGNPLFDDAGKPVLVAPDVQRDKLRVETRFRLASKLAREKFGEMNEVKVTGSVSLIAVLSGLPKGRVFDAAEMATGSHAAIVDAAPVEANAPAEKIAEKTGNPEEVQTI